MHWASSCGFTLLLGLLQSASFFVLFDLCIQRGSLIIDGPIVLTLEIGIDEFIIETCSIQWLNNIHCRNHNGSEYKMRK